MSDITDVGLVDTHPERNSGNKAKVFFHSEGILIVRFDLRVHSCVIGSRLDAMIIKP